MPSVPQRRQDAPELGQAPRDLVGVRRGLDAAVPDQRLPPRRRARQGRAQAAPERPPDVEAEHRLVLPEARQEEADLAQGVERDVVIEGAARGDVEAAVAPLAEGHTRRPDGAGRDGRRRRRARDRAAHPPLRQREAEGPREPPRPRARGADHPGGGDLAALGHDRAHRAAASGDAFHRAPEVDASRRGPPRRARGRRWPSRDRRGRRSACRGRRPTGRRARERRSASRRARRCGCRGRSRAPRAATARRAPCAASLAASARLPPCTHSMSAPSSASSPRQKRFDSIIRGSSLRVPALLAHEAPVLPRLLAVHRGPLHDDHAQRPVGPGNRQPRNRRFPLRRRRRQHADP